MQLQNAILVVPLLFQATFASPTVQHAVQRSTSSQPACGVVGKDCGKYLLTKAQCSVAQCEALCKKNSKCKSYGYGQNTCRLYSAAVKDNVTRKSGSPYKFYDRACPCPFSASPPRTTTSVKQTTTTSSTTSQRKSTTSLSTTRATTATAATTTASTTTSVAATTTSACPGAYEAASGTFTVGCDKALPQTNPVKVVKNVASLFACIDTCDDNNVCNAVSYVKDGRQPSYGHAGDCVQLKFDVDESVFVAAPGVDSAYMPQQR